tara:strand:- start:3523 stop:4167 length:645 start_codon:yes stop_codon:yes gene_type:complete
MVEVKICGLNTAPTLAAAISGGAKYLGFVFYPPSPRNINISDFARLASAVPPNVKRVGLFVDANDDFIARMIASARLDMLQLHGAETPDRVTAVKKHFKLRVMKAIKVSSRADLRQAKRYEAVTDYLLFDAKAPKKMRSALPGGNALTFDWHLLNGINWSKPWMLSGGLNADNVAKAIQVTGARMVDVSSGVEENPGTKSRERISEFLKAVSAI